MRVNRGRPEHSRRGSVLLESAFILPIFFFLLFAGIEMGRALWIRNVITDAAAEGARMAVLPEPTDADVVAAVEARISGQGVVAPHTVQVGNRAPGTAVTVSVEADLDFLVLPRLVENALHLDKVAASAVVTGLP